VGEVSIRTHELLTPSQWRNEHILLHIYNLRNLVSGACRYNYVQLDN